MRSLRVLSGSATDRYLKRLGTHHRLCLYISVPVYVRESEGGL